MTRRRVRVFPDAHALASAVAERFLRTIGSVLQEREVADVVLTGGTTGIEVLAAVDRSPLRTSVPWQRVRLWWGDERWLPEGDPERNDTQARAALLDHLALDAASVHRFGAADGPDDQETAARRYTQALAAVAGTGLAPRFDLTFLGVGPDGHIASLFPGHDEVLSTAVGALAVRNSPKPPPERLSLTLPTINGSERIWLCLAGADKASALARALTGSAPAQVPAAGVEGRMETVFFVDRAAAAGVPQELLSSE
jgi:6-phosphogluconolactonase